MTSACFGPNTFAPIEVAAAVIVCGSHILLAKRTEGVLADMWEFPGGKLESGESPAQAVVRELLEELSLEVIPHERLLVLEHEYPDKRVRLHFVRCELAIKPSSNPPQPPAPNAAWFLSNEFPINELCPADRIAANNILWKTIVRGKE